MLIKNAIVYKNGHNIGNRGESYDVNIQADKILLVAYKGRGKVDVRVGDNLVVTFKSQDQENAVMTQLGGL